MAAESIKKTFWVALCLCVVCSILVSTTAVVLKPRQDENRSLDKKKNLLIAAGLIQGQERDREVIENAFAAVEGRVVDLATGKMVDDIDPTIFDPRQAAQGPDSYSIPPKKDLAKLRNRAKQAVIYLVKKDDKISQVVLPIHGKGLYSTLYGFLALGVDTKTVQGFAFYEQGETPGLGGEVENPAWKAQWRGKVLYDQDWRPNIQVVKGGVNPASPEAIHQVDAISGATMTSRGVENLLHYWLGDDGYGRFLTIFRNQRGVK